MANTARTRVIVGVFPGQPDAVVDIAAAFATRFDAELVCAWVDASRYVITESADGSVTSMPIDTDLGDATDHGIPPKLQAQLTRILEHEKIEWSTRALAGDPGRALGHLGEVLDAAMIVVGTRAATVRGTLQEFFGGSVAAHLAHRQHRPTVVVPLSPVSFDRELSWEPA